MYLKLSKKTTGEPEYARLRGSMKLRPFNLIRIMLWRMREEILTGKNSGNVQLIRKLPKKIREERKPELEESCSMCSKFCAVRSMNKALAGEYIDIL